MSASILDPRMIDPSKPLVITNTVILSNLQTGYVNTPGGDSLTWNNVSTVVQNNSASWEETPDINNLTTILNTNSGNWNQAYVRSLSSNLWNNVFTTVQNSSALWEETADIIPTVTNYLVTSSIVINNLTVPYTLSATNLLVSGLTSLSGIFITETITDSVFVDVSSYKVNELTAVNIQVTNNLLATNITGVNIETINGIISGGVNLYDIIVNSNLGRIDINTTVQTGSANWNQGYDVSTVVQNNSATNWNSVAQVASLTTIVLPNSANWNQAYTTSLSSNLWNDIYTTVRVNSASWEESVDISAVTTIVSANSANWDSAYTTSLSSNFWNQTFTNVQTNVAPNSANWNQAFNVSTIVQNNSASWEETGDILPTVTNFLSTSNVVLSSVTFSDTLFGATSATQVSTGTLSARTFSLVHSPANDGVDPIIDIGETLTDSFSGFRIRYEEPTNRLIATSRTDTTILTSFMITTNTGQIGISGLPATGQALTVTGNVSATGDLFVGASSSSTSVGSLQYTSNTFYATPSANGRGVLPAVLFTTGVNPSPQTNTTTGQNWFATAADELTLAPSTTYMFEGVFNINTTGTVSNSLGISIKGSGTAGIASIAYAAHTTNGTAATTNTTSTTYVTTETNTTVTGTVGAATNRTIHVRGILRTSVAGTIIPQFTYSAAPGGTATLNANNFFMLYPIGPASVISSGAWT